MPLPTVSQVTNLHETSMNGAHSVSNEDASSREDAERDDEVIDIVSEDGSQDCIPPTLPSAGPSNLNNAIQNDGRGVVPPVKSEDDAEQALPPPIFPEDEDDDIDVVISDSEEAATSPSPADHSPTGRSRNAAALPAPGPKPAAELSSQTASLKPAEFHYTWPCTSPAAREAHLLDIPIASIVTPISTPLTENT